MPIEIVQFCWEYNLQKLQNLPELEGSVAKLRKTGDKPYVTDNSNYIVDLYFEKPHEGPLCGGRGHQQVLWGCRARAVPQHGRRLHHGRLKRHRCQGEESHLNQHHLDT